MGRLPGVLLALAIIAFCAGCIPTVTPAPPTAALITATPQSVTSSPTAASPTAIAIITSALTDTVLPPTAAATVAAPTLPAGQTSTPLPAIPTSTPFPSAPSETAAPQISPSPAPTANSTATPTTPAPATALPVGVISFSIAPQTINPGDSVTLIWQATGEQAAIYRQDPGGPLDDMHTVPLSGTLTVQVPGALRNNVVYVLYVGAGASTASATVSAVIRCPDKYFFANPPAGCPSGPGTVVQMAAEHFQQGVMLWLSSQNAIYILYGDGGSPAWQSVPNTWVQGQPENDPTLTPPAGLFQPVRGFGAAWRATDVAGAPTVRNRLGWATDTESALTGSYQCDSTPKYSNCFISGAGGVVYWLKPESSAWQVWKGP